MSINKLTDKQVRAIVEPGNHADGGNLYVRVRESGAKSFILKGTFNGRQREWTIGRYGNRPGELSLADARKRRDEMMTEILAGKTPLVGRKARSIVANSVEAENASAKPTFGNFAIDHIAQIEGGFGNAKHRKQWHSTLKTYCAPIWETPVDEVSTEDVLNILLPIWLKRNETASRVQGRIERVLGAAKVKGLRSGENPAMWHGHLKLLLPARTKLQRGHHPALAVEAMPAFWQRLEDTQTIAADALRFLILTASRSGEVRLAQWSEFDLKNRLWTIPADRMKARKEHVVPLSDTCITIVERMQRIRHSEYVFPGARDNTALSDMTLGKIVKKWPDKITVHGFRSTFRDWCGEKTNFSRENAELCLAHSVGNAVERAYRRGNALEQRRVIMTAWERFVLTGRSPVDINNQPPINPDQHTETENNSMETA